MQTPGPWTESDPPPCFCPAAVPSPRLAVKEQLHVHSPKITFGPLKATERLMWPPVKMSRTPRIYSINPNVTTKITKQTVIVISQQKDKKNLKNQLFKKKGRKRGKVNEEQIGQMENVQQGYG